MANGQVHRNVGMLAGAAGAFYDATRQPVLPVDFIAEVAGGALVGRLVGRLPDVLEPAVSSYHRSVAHSVTVGVAVAVKVPPVTRTIAQAARERAERYRALAQQTENPWLSLWYTLVRLFWSMVAGGANALAPAYVSHLVLDAFTPRGIPLVAQGLV